MTRIVRRGDCDGEAVTPTEEPNAWKKTVARTLIGLRIIPEKFSGELVVNFKDGGVSYLKKTETLK
jgi:hypothetical protein